MSSIIIIIAFTLGLTLFAEKQESELDNFKHALPTILNGSVSETLSNADD